MSEYKVKVGNPLSKLPPRSEMEEELMNLGFGLNYIDALSDRQMFERIIIEGCKNNK